MTKTKDFSINFSGITHDHNSLNSSHAATPDHRTDEDYCSTIAILRRHPMYDCLVLVKRYRSCIGGYALEFPMSRPDDKEQEAIESEQVFLDNQEQQGGKCQRQKLVSRFLDGDDLIYQSNRCSQDQQATGVQDDEPLAHPFSASVGEIGQDDELVHVPVNGLLDRLKGYTSGGVAVDSRVYAFAMGLKTAERLLTTGFEKELQETPKI